MITMVGDPDVETVLTTLALLMASVVGGLGFIAVVKVIFAVGVQMVGSYRRVIDVVRLYLDATRLLVIALLIVVAGGAASSGLQGEEVSPGTGVMAAALVVLSVGVKDGAEMIAARRKPHWWYERLDLTTAGQ
ncbi:hypothetical protein [Nesterenkonia halobia]|uniref:hypothetical protein n=1 Tax=Nesterenkonia halobia TaxID=37922 RepID=UPI0031CF7FDE